MEKRRSGVHGETNRADGLSCPTLPCIYVYRPREGRWVAERLEEEVTSTRLRALGGDPDASGNGRAA